MEKIAILGAGSWGTALGIHLGRAGHDVRLWARDEALVRGIVKRRTNPRYLSGPVIPDNVLATADAREALEGAGTVVLAVPSHVMREVVRSMRTSPSPPARCLPGSPPSRTCG